MRKDKNEALKYALAEKVTTKYLGFFLFLKVLFQDGSPIWHCQIRQERGFKTVCIMDHSGVLLKETEGKLIKRYKECE